MDFAVAFILYIILTAVVAFIYVFKDSPFLNIAPIVWLKAFIDRGFMHIQSLMPEKIKSAYADLRHSLLYTRNPFFQILYMLLVSTIYVIFIIDGLRYLQLVEPAANHLLVPMFILFVNSTFFLVSSWSDPGLINAKNLPPLLNVYKYDGVIYKENNTCTTCRLVKPARSKHCAVYNRCIFKFDHYCVWTNNGVGAFNHRYFVLHLASLAMMCFYGSYIGHKMLANITDLYQLWTLKFVEDDGSASSMNYRVLIQTLFMRHPRLVVLTPSLFFLGLFISWFTLYHFSLAVNNQTTNERYKLHANRKVLVASTVKPHQYSRGILRNLVEEFFPGVNIANSRKVT